MGYTRESDGIDHINVFSRGKTQLGRFLSNFAFSPISTLEDGDFDSIEAYWYWLNCSHVDRDILRKTHGYESKKLGRELGSNDWNDSVEFLRKIKSAIYIKIFKNYGMAIQLKNSELPLTHYYEYKGKVVEESRGKWFIEFLEVLRARMNRCENIIYRSGSVFDAPKGSYLAHSCNTKGEWGAGVALEFKKRFPNSYNFQRKLCEEYSSKNWRLLGSAAAEKEDGYTIISLFTSKGYGKEKSSELEILENTVKSLAQAMTGYVDDKEFWIPKINSGYFGVAWEKTEIVLLGLMLIRPKIRLIISEY